MKDRQANILLWKNKIWESKVSNSGDLAIIRNTFLKLQEEMPNSCLHILSDDADHVAKQYGVVAHPISILRHPLRFAALLHKMDLVILGGGTVLQDDYFVGIIPINISVPLLAKAFGAKIVCNAIGVGSEEELSKIGYFLCRLALPRFDSITVRDEESKRLVERWTRGNVPITVTNDIAVDLPSAAFSTIENALKDEGIDFDARPTVVIAARKIFHHEKTMLYFLPGSLRHRLKLEKCKVRERIDEFKTQMAQFSDFLVEKYDVNVVFMPFYSSGGSADSTNNETQRRFFSSGDTEFAEDIMQRVQHREQVHLLRRNYSPEEMLTIISKSTAMVGVPYHSIVFASSRNVPVIGINYVSKVARYMRILEMSDYIVDADFEKGFSLETLEAAFDRLWENREAIRHHLKAKNRDLIALSDKNFKLMKQVLPSA